MSVATEIERIQNAKTNIKTAIENKGVTVGDITIDGYAAKIDEITGGSSKYAPRYITFRSYRGTELDEEVNNLDTSNMTTFNGLFYDCSNIISLDLSHFNTKNITHLGYMFYNMASLANVNLSNFDTSNVKIINNMFNYCGALKELNLNHFDVSNVTEASNLFNNCSSLVSLDIGKWSMDSLKLARDTFYNCFKLQHLTFPKNWGKKFTQKTTNYMYYTIQLYASNSLTHDSLMSVINNLYDLNLSYDVANGGTLYTQKLEIGSTNIAKLTAEEIQIATDKGWTVS